MEVLYKLIVSLWVCVARHAQSTQNNKFAFYSQYLKKSLKDEADFLLVEEHQRTLQVDVIILGVWPGMHKLPKITSLLFLSNILRK